MSAASVTYVAAFGGGVASCLSPCVLPIVPGYLSMITGVDGATLRTGRGTEPAPAGRTPALRIARDTGLFVAGFTAVFVGLGLTATEIGSSLLREHLLLTRISGALVLAMALFLAGSLLRGAPALYGERRFHPDASRLGPFAAPVAGAAFGFGWTPCIGPILSSVLAVAAVRGRAGQGAGLLVAYSLGLGVPFLVIGLAAGKLNRTIGFLERHSRVITLVSALVLGALGVLLVLNRLTLLTVELERVMRDIGLGRLITIG